MTDDPNALGNIDPYFVGTRQPGDDNSMFRALSFLIRQIVNRHWTGTMVSVVAVHPGAGSPPLVGTVDVQPLVNQVTGLGTAFPHAVIFGVPYSRLQGGTTGAIICDPQVGDTGWAAFADHDISSVIANQGAQSNPGSARRFSASDAFFVADWPTELPTTYVWFDGLGNCNVVTPSANAITLTTGTLNLFADTINMAAMDGSSETTVNLTGSQAASDYVTADGVSLATHVHSGVSTGSDDTGPPT